MTAPSPPKKRERGKNSFFPLSPPPASHHHYDLIPGIIIVRVTHVCVPTTHQHIFFLPGGRRGTQFQPFKAGKKSMIPRGAL